MSVLRTAAYRLAFIFLLVCSSCSNRSSSVSVYFEKPDGSTSPSVKVEVASNAGQRRLGLMYRREMAEDAGMLFIFPKNEELSFWMKNTYLELDMIFIDDQFKVVSVIHRAVPLSTSKRPSEGPATYVLEVLGGKAEAWGISKGNKLVVEGQLPKPL